MGSCLNCDFFDFGMGMISGVRGGWLWNVGCLDFPFGAAEDMGLSWGLRGIV